MELPAAADLGFREVWSILGYLHNQPATVSVSRLRQVNVGIVTLPQEHFNKVHALVLSGYRLLGRPLKNHREPRRLPGNYLLSARVAVTLAGP